MYEYKVNAPLDERRKMIHNKKKIILKSPNCYLITAEVPERNLVLNRRVGWEDIEIVGVCLLSVYF